jgi:hypothetical protein
MLNILILVFSACLTFTVLEFAARLYGAKTVLAWTDFRGETLSLYKMRLPIQFDSTLGWIPQIGFSTTENKWGTQVTIVEHGIRSNGNSDEHLRDRTPILTVGDSFTFGDEVADTDTWPAILERLLSKRVINAGVFAYGIDQSFIRLTMLLNIYEPDTVIFSFIPTDIVRAEYLTFVGANKPYFKVLDNTLVLMNAPVKSPSTRPIPTLHRISGYSYLIQGLMMKLIPNWWVAGGYSWYENHTGARGEEVACLIFQELQTIANQKKIKNVYVLVQYDASLYPRLQARVDYVKGCIDKEAITIIDLKNRLLEVQNHSPERYSAFFRAHMTYEGNYFVAENIVAAIKSN